MSQHFPSRTSSVSRSQNFQSPNLSPTKDAKGLPSSNSFFQRTDSTSTGYDFHKKMSSAQFSSPNALTNQTSSDYLGSPRRQQPMQSRNDSPHARSVIMKSNDPCLESDYTNPIDELLEEGFTIVNERKDRKEEITKNNEQLEKDILRVNKEMIPEIERTKTLKDIIRECEGVKTKHIKDIENTEAEIRRVRELIEKKKQATKEMQEGFVGVIHGLEDELDVIKTQMAITREVEQQGVAGLTQKIVNTKLEDRELKEDIKTLKQQVEAAKGHQVNINRALETKAMTYIGMIQRK